MKTFNLEINLIYENNEICLYSIKNYDSRINADYVYVLTYYINKHLIIKCLNDENYPELYEKIIEFYYPEL